MRFKKHIDKKCKAKLCPLIEMSDAETANHPCRDTYENCATWQESCGGHFKVL